MEAIMKLNRVISATILGCISMSIYAAQGGSNVTPLDSGTSGNFMALPDYVDNSALTETNAYSFTVDLTDNDGIVVADPTGLTNILLTCQSAEYIETPGQWQDIGPLTNTEATLYYDQGALPRSVNSSYPGITRAMICNGSELSELYYKGATSAGNILPDNADKKSASIEFWVRPDASVFNSQISTLYETGGGTGIGIIIDNGTLRGATGFNIAPVSYDLNADPMSVLPYDPTNEFFQVVMVTDLDNDINQLYVNGVKVSEATGNTITDWDGGDSAGVGRFQGTNHGGFIGNAAGTPYDTYYAGAIAAIRFYGVALTPSQVQQNFEAITVPSATAADSIEIAGIYNPGGSLISGTNTPITLDSGGVVTLDSASGNFTYDPTGISGIGKLWKGCYITDTFTCQVTNSGGYASDSKVTVAIYGTSQSTDVSVEAEEKINNTITASQLLAGDQLDHDNLDPFVAYYASPDLLAEPYNGEGMWINAGNGGSVFDATSDTADLIPVVSGFGGISYAVLEAQCSAMSPAYVSEDDMTIELWFKPDLDLTGEQVLYETGGSGNGSMLIYNADDNTVEAYIDGGADTDPDLQLYASIGGISWEEFNQVIAVFDIKNGAAADTLTLYVNNDPSAAFSSAGAITASNPAGDIILMSGNDKAGITTTSGTTALLKSFSTFKGQLSHIRVYDGILSSAQMAKAYDSIRRPLTTVTGTTDLPGASATLNADGTIDYDTSVMTTNILYGETAIDSISYQFTDSDGSTVSRTAPVTVTGAGAAVAVDDVITINEDLTSTNFNPTLNDILTAGIILTNEIVVADFLDDYTAGTTVGQLADFRDINGYGWSYMWNAPTGWVDTLPYDGTSGAITDTNAYQFLLWDSNNWAVNDDNVSDSGAPGEWVSFTSVGGHPGSGPEDGTGNTIQRRPIAAYTVSQAGYYGIAKSLLKKNSTANNPIHVIVLVNNNIMFSRIGPNNTLVDFDCELGYLNAGDTVYVGIGPYISRGSDSFSLDYSIVRLPGPSAKVSSAAGTLLTDGSSLTFTPGSGYDALAAGQSYTETLTYTVLDGGELTTASVTIEITGVNDAPTTIADGATIDEDTTSTGGNVLANDDDIDKGDELTLSVAEVQGATGNVGVPFTTPLGATATINPDGSFSYDCTAVTNIFNTLSASNYLYDTFSYLVQDSHGLDAPAPATVTITIEGLNDPVTATDNGYIINPGEIIHGEMILEDAGYGVDSDPDVNDVLTIDALNNTNSIIGNFKFRPQVSRLACIRGQTTINGTVKTITYDPDGSTFYDPVVFTTPAGNNETEPGSIKITNIDAVNGTFDIVFKEQREDGALSDIDGNDHADEDISWMVFEAGEYQLPNGVRFEVGKVSTNYYRQDTGPENWLSVEYSTVFTNQPIVINQLQSWNDPYNELFGTRMNGTTYAGGGVKSNKFQVAMEDLEGDQNDSSIQHEVIGWLAIEESSGTWDGNPYQAGVSPNSFTQGGTVNNFAFDFGTVPDVIACLATVAGGDPSTLRYNSISSSQYNFYVSEDTYGETEIGHAAEWATFLAIGGTDSKLYAIDLDPSEGFFTYDSAGIDVTGGSVIETFTYTVTDNNGSSDTKTVTITIEAPAGTVLLIQ